MKHIKPILLITVTLFALLAALSWMTVPVGAQAYYQTPTAGADGRIIYKVKAGDNCLSISLLTGVDLDNIRLYNNLDQDCNLTEGQELLLGIVESATATPQVTAPAGPVEPTPTPLKGNGAICIWLFNDVNGNARADDGEVAIQGGGISITDPLGKISLTGTSTDQAEALCFEDIPEGDYNISVAPPEGYNPTTTMNYPLSLKAGDRSTLDFGAQASSQAQPDEAEAAGNGGGRSPLLAILGVVFLLAGIGLGFFMFRLRR
jgi:hypothetical protein